MMKTTEEKIVWKISSKMLIMVNLADREFEIAVVNHEWKEIHNLKFFSLHFLPSSNFLIKQKFEEKSFYFGANLLSKKLGKIFFCTELIFFQI
jgi:hypothetical protein